MKYFSDQSHGDSLQWVNRILEMANLPPVVSLATATMGSDAGLVLNRLNTTIRNEAARGWWFNTKLRESFTTDEFGALSINYAVSAKASVAQVGEDVQPHVQLKMGEAGLSGIVVNTEDADGLLEPDTEYLLDVVYMPTPNNMPIAFAEYCVLKTGRQFAAGFGIKVDPYDEEDARDRLEKAESSLAPTPNRFDNPEILRQRIR